MRASALILTLLVLLALLLTAAWAEEYLIKPGDTLSITVVDEADLTKKAIVDSPGRIALPLVKEVEVGGLTAVQAAETLTAALKQYIKSPQVIIEVLETAKIRVSVSGEVRNAGIVVVPQGARLMEAMTSAGGYTQNADLSKVSVTHSGEARASVVDLSAFLLGGDVSANVQLADGDVVVVPSKALPSIGRVSVLGAVSQPGSFEINNGATVREAILMAGGPTENADLENCTIRRDGSAEGVSINYAQVMQGDREANVVLRPGDVIYVSARQQLGYYTIQGAINAAGRYELKGRTTLTEAIAIAGGVGNKARLGEVRILRASEGASTTLKVNVSDVMAGKTANPDVQNGDQIFVPQAKDKANTLQWASIAVSLLWLLTNSSD